MRTLRNTGFLLAICFAMSTSLAGLAQGSPGAPIDPHPEIPDVDWFSPAKRGPNQLVVEMTVSQSEFTRKWPRVRSAQIQIKRSDRWRVLSGRAVHLAGGGYDRFWIRATLPSEQSRVVARFVLRAGKRVLKKSEPMLVKRTGVKLRAKSVSVGYGQTCAVLRNHRASCWGVNTYGELGIGNKRNKVRPVPVKRLGKVASVSAADGYTCAIKLNRRLFCWGNNYGGVLGTGNWYDSRLPRRVQGLKGVKEVSPGNIGACAVKFRGTVYCWGDSGGFGSKETFRLSPKKVRGVKHAISVETGNRKSCAIKRNHRVVCWDMRTFKLKPGRKYGKVKLLHLELDASGCAVRASNRLVCWGDNLFGQLGNGTRKSRRQVRPVRGVGKVRDISSDGNQVCALQFSGKVYCWGGNSGGSLGIGTYRNRLVPTLVPGLTGGQSIDGDFYGGSCVVRRNKAVLCWGDNSAGSLGTGTLVNQLLPAPVLSGRNSRSSE